MNFDSLGSVSYQSTCPANLKIDIYETFFETKPEKLTSIWNSLNRRESFVKGQPFPYRVEFDADEQEGPFQPGELNIHHGPLLSVHGSIGDVSDTYRSLNYFWGSYVLSFRWIRPTKLEFFREDNGIRLKIHCYVKPGIKPLWRLINGCFWKLAGINFLL